MRVLRATPVPPRCRARATAVFHIRWFAHCAAYGPYAVPAALPFD